MHRQQQKGASVIARTRSVRVVGAWLGVALVALLVVGCVDIEMKSDFRADGGALQSVEITIEKSALAQLEQVGGGEVSSTFTDTEGAQATAEAAGLDYESIDNDQAQGARVSKDVEDSSDLEATFNEIFSNVATDEQPVPTGAVTGSYEQDGGEYRLDMTIDSDVIFEGLEEGVEESPVSADQIFDFVYIATFPGEVKETNGTKVGEDQVRWELPLTGSTQLTAVAEGEGGGMSPLIFVLLVVILLLAGLAVAYLLLRRRSQPTPALATAGPMTVASPATTPPDATMTVTPDDTPPQPEAGTFSSQSIADTDTNMFESSDADTDNDRTDDQETTRLPR